MAQQLGRGNGGCDGDEILSGGDSLSSSRGLSPDRLTPKDNTVLCAITNAAKKEDLSELQSLIETTEQHSPGYWQSPKGIYILRQVASWLALSEHYGAAVIFLCGNFGLPIYKLRSDSNLSLGSPKSLMR